MYKAHDGMVGQSPDFLGLRQEISCLLQHWAPGTRPPPILIQGETGTGKGLLARVIHEASHRAAEPLVDVDCAAIPETLFESELFGFERGTFTGANQAKPGLFRTAHRGTILLDEVGLLPKSLQAKLLKIVEERGVRRLGSTRSETVDVWILAATNEDLSVATREGRFREDLYHRLAAVTLRLPPLRERGEDILLLAEHFLARNCGQYGLLSKVLAPDAREALLGYSWPGNVRELANVMERVVLLHNGETITADLLGLPAGSLAGPTGEVRGAPGPLRLSVERFERETLLAVLGQAGWNVSLAAARLGVPRNTLRYRISRLGLRPEPGTPRQDRPAAQTIPGPGATHEGTTGAQRSAEPTAEIPSAETASVALPPVWEARAVTMLRAAITQADGDTEPNGLARALDVLVEKTHLFGGRVEAIEGTTLTATFGVRSAADAAGRALLAALAIVKVGERWQDERGVTVRVVAHTAQLLVRRDGDDAEISAGDRAEIAAALDDLLAQAGPNTVVATEAVLPPVGSVSVSIGHGGPSHAARISISRASNDTPAGSPSGVVSGSFRFGRLKG